MSEEDEGELKKRMSEKIQWHIVPVPLVDLKNQPSGSAPMNLPLITKFDVDTILEDAKKEYPFGLSVDVSWKQKDEWFVYWFGVKKEG
jgi:hypothetical protein